MTTATCDRKRRKVCSPGRGPYKSCRNDSQGFIPLTSNSGWSLDRAQASTVSVDGRAWEWGMSASVGFTKDIDQDYEAPGNAITTYICGANALPNIPTIYSTR